MGQIVIPLLKNPSTGVRWISDSANFPKSPPAVDFQTISTDDLECPLCSAQVEYDYPNDWYICMVGHLTSRQQMMQLLTNAKT